MEKVGVNIKKIRELRNYSRTYMARELKVSINTYGKMERDERSISVRRLYELAKILDVDVHLILDFDENKMLGILRRAVF